MRRHLDGQRGHVLGILEGLTDEQLRRPVLPSGWSCLQMVRHLTIADERYWFRHVMGGAPGDILPSGPRADWEVGDDETAADVLDLYRQEIEWSDELLATTDPDEPPRHPDPRWDEWGMSFPDLRTITMHVLTETAVHAGHLDAARELLDGRQWIVLD
ncbi:MAG: DinB family protein [Ilumatobacteraceae bacterium]